MKNLLIFLVILIALFFAWNKLTCQFCQGDNAGSTMTMRECAIHGQDTPITKEFVWVGWQVNIWVPFVGCISNDPTPLYLNAGPVRVTIGGWFKGWHRVRVIHFRLQ